MTELPLVVEHGTERLLGIVHAPVGASDLGIVIVVGGPQYRAGSHRQFVLLARALAAGGFPVLRFDYRGMGDSDGTLRTFEDVGDDIRAAIAAFRSAVPALERIVVFGLCDAASALLMHCSTEPAIRGMILVNPWVRTEAGEARSYLRHYYLQRLLMRSFWRKVLSGKFEAGKSVREFGQAVKQAGAVSATSAGSTTLPFIERMYTGLNSFDGDVLLLISGRDLTAQQFVELCTSDRRWRRAITRKNVQRLDLPAADHTFSVREWLDKSNDACLQWLRLLQASK